MSRDAIARAISQQVEQVSEAQVLQVLSLLDDGATVPFIARYRQASPLWAC
eukprot:COSAG05_NODE_1881_length_3907_cov_92.844275_5_plen_51_part_00